MKLFECVVNDGINIFKSLGTAKSKKEFKEVYGGNGEFLSIKDVTSEYFTEESPDLLNKHLLRMGWGEAERLIICGLLQEHIEKTR